nr:hypothetical protein CFP56_53817 [Quercus suber]
MYILEDWTPSFHTSIAGTSWSTEEILDDMKKYGQCSEGGKAEIDVPTVYPISILGNTENLSSTSRPRLIENEDRLPGAVLLARTRLLERLRGVPLSANRGSGRLLSDRTELMLEDGVRELVDDRDVGTKASAGQSAGS